MNHSSDAIRPHAVWYVAGLVVLFAGMGLARWQIASGKSTLKDKAQSVRGSATIQIKQAGSHSVYVRRGASQRMDAAADRAWKTARGAVVTVRDERAGSELSVRNTYETMDMQNNLLARLVEFDVPEAGSYTVRIEPS
ncbi:MAG: hypothetical protein HQ581_17690, partial [Planctomycetes bacterium]|nr:hypothetical protein [Planctomycetota bacterium]